jgi:hypothetical protein
LLTWLALIVHIALWGTIISGVAAILAGCTLFCLWLTGRSGSVALAACGSIIGIAVWCAIILAAASLALVVLGLVVWLTGS